MQSDAKMLFQHLSKEEIQTIEKLYESQELLNTLIDELPNFLVLKDENGNFLLCNRAVATFYGTTPQQMVGKDDGDFGVPKDIADSLRQNVLDIMQKGETSVVLEESRDANTGEIRHFRSIKKPFKDAYGKNRILVIATDVTDIIESQKKLTQSENTLKEVISIAKEGIWDYDVANNRVTFSPQWYASLKIP